MLKRALNVHVDKSQKIRFNLIDQVCTFAGEGADGANQIRSYLAFACNGKPPLNAIFNKDGTLNKTEWDVSNNDNMKI